MIPTAAPRFGPDRRPGPLEVVVARSAPASVDARALRALGPGERERAAGFRRPEDAARFVTGRTLARRLLGERLGLEPAAVDLVVPHPNWKPRVPGSSLDVSIAHADGVVVVALADGAEVGIDVEGGPEVLRALDEATWTTATAPGERDAVGPLAWPRSGPVPAATADAFLRHWTRKEAVLKVIRLGLAVPMDGVVLRDGPAPAVLAVPEGLPAPGDLALVDLDAPPGLRIALAVLTRRAVVVRDAGTGTDLGTAPGVQDR